MKLTIEHLAPYLPYDLNVLDGDTKILVGLQKGHVILRQTNITHSLYDIRLGYEFIKPILRPMSDLINEIEINGRKIVPLSFLKHSGTRLNKSKVGRDSLNIPSYYECEDNEGHELRFYLKEMYFAQRYKCEPRECVRHFEMIRQLFEWNFDVFGLIEQGLALNINEI